MWYQFVYLYSQVGWSVVSVCIFVLTCRLECGISFDICTHMYAGVRYQFVYILTGRLECDISLYIYTHR